MKKFFCIFLAALLITGTVCLSFLQHDTYAVPMEITWMHAVGLLQGDEKGDLLLEKNLTRAEAAALIIRAMGIDAVSENGESPFPDVSSEHWAIGYIIKASENKMINGYPDKTFRPEDNVIYEEFVKMLVSSLGGNAPEGTYPDNYILKATELGITKDLEIEQGKKLNRYESAMLLYNALNCRSEILGSTLKEKYLLYASEHAQSSNPFGAEDGAKLYAERSYKTADAAGESAIESFAAAEPPRKGGATYVLPDDFYYEGNEPEAGQLTAGECDDIKNRSEWQVLMADKEYYTYTSNWGIPTDWYAIKVISESETAVWDAEVTLYDGEKNRLSSGRTNKDGMVYLFAEKGGDNEQGNYYEAEISKDGDVLYQGEITLSDGDPAIITVGETAKPEGLDLMFVIDTTGSMGDELQYIKSEIKDVVLKIDAPVRCSLNFYRDFGDIYTVRPFPFETDIDTCVSQISAQRASGGGDYEEAVDMALIDAVNEHDWSDSAKARLLFLVLDAPPHGTDEVISNMQGIIAEARNKGIRIIPVASSGVDKNTEFLLRSIAISTGGTYLFLTDDSGIGNPHIAPSVSDYEVTYLNELILSVIKRYIGQEN